MRIKATVTNGAMTWDEDFEDSDIEDPQEYMVQMLRRFNLGLRPGEEPRQLVRVVKLSDEGLGKHSWEKTNFITIKGRHGMYDTAKCRKCGVTAKRFGIGGDHVPDAKFKAEKYSDCNWMKEAK